MAVYIIILGLGCLARATAALEAAHQDELALALRRETAPLVEVDSGGVACEASVSVEARLTEEEAQRLQALRDLCPGFFALPGKWGLDRQPRRRKPITEKQRSGVSFARTAQGAYITRVG